MKSVELTDKGGLKFFFISECFKILNLVDDLASLVDTRTGTATYLEDKYSDLLHIYGVTTNPRIKKGR